MLWNPISEKRWMKKKTVKTMQARVNYYALFDNKITNFGFLYEAMVDEGEKIESEQSNCFSRIRDQGSKHNIQAEDIFFKDHWPGK